MLCAANRDRTSRANHAAKELSDGINTSFIAAASVKKFCMVFCLTLQPDSTEACKLHAVHLKHAYGTEMKRCACYTQAFISHALSFVWLSGRGQVREDFFCTRSSTLCVPCHSFPAADCADLIGSVLMIGCKCFSNLQAAKKHLCPQPAQAKQVNTLALFS